MKVLVCGGRDFDDADFLNSVMDKILKKHKDITVIHGSCRTGADNLVELWCKENEVNYQGYPARWKTLGRKAGPIRNAEMIRDGKPDVVVGFKGGTGTENMCNTAEQKGINVWRTWE